MEIFKSGTHTDMRGRPLTFSDADLAATAAAYNPAQYRAPLVVGHPAMDDPAFGEVSGLRFADGTLHASFANVDPTLKAAVDAGRFLSCSAQFWEPGAPNSPTPEVWALCHVGLLGATAPAVKGLARVSFATGTPGMAQFGGNTMSIQSAPPAGGDAAAAELARREADLAAREANLKAQTAAFAEMARQTRHAEHERAASELAQKGVLVGPAEQAGMVAFLDGLDATFTVSFADGAQTVAQPGVQWLLGLLGRSASRLPPLGAVAGGAVAPAQGAAAFSDPNQLVAASAAYRKQLADQGIEISPTEAVLRVMGGGK